MNHLASLLEKVPYKHLLKGVAFEELLETTSFLKGIDKEFEKSPVACALAYLVGIRQGVHNERERRRVASE